MSEKKELITQTTELNYLNREHRFSIAGNNNSGIISKIKNKIRNFLLGDYLQKEQEYFANLVRQLNRISKETDELQSLDSIVKGLESMLAVVGVRKGESNVNQELINKVDFTYWLLENRFRGSEEEISRRLQIYPEIFALAKGAVLDLGCGRGELLKEFKKKGISAYGIELNVALLEHCKNSGLDVRNEDILKHLNSLPDASLGGFVAIQVVEHLPYSLIRELFVLLSRKLQPSAKLVFETINVLSLLPFAHNYFRDPTHQPPLHPDTLKFTLEISGFQVIELRKLSPYPEGAKLKELKSGEPFSPSLQQSMEVINSNFRQLNELIYSEQDYCIIAENKLVR